MKKELSSSTSKSFSEQEAERHTDFDSVKPREQNCPVSVFLFIILIYARYFCSCLVVEQISNMYQICAIQIIHQNEKAIFHIT